MVLLGDIFIGAGGELAFEVRDRRNTAVLLVSEGKDEMKADLSSAKGHVQRRVGLCHERHLRSRKLQGRYTALWGGTWLVRGEKALAEELEFKLAHLPTPVSVGRAFTYPSLVSSPSYSPIFRLTSRETFVCFIHFVLSSLSSYVELSRNTVDRISFIFGHSSSRLLSLFPSSEE